MEGAPRAGAAGAWGKPTGGQGADDPPAPPERDYAGSVIFSIRKWALRWEVAISWYLNKVAS